MSKIVLLPLDERPCNALYPVLSPRSGCLLAVAPRAILGQKKTPANLEGISAWLTRECADASALVVSLDMLLYGGIVPSRLHHESEDVLHRRADLLRELKKANPSLRIYAFELLMRCPFYDSDDEEPSYYEKEGSAIFKNGYYGDLADERPLTASEKADLLLAKGRLVPSDLEDYLSRRKANLDALCYCLSLFKEGVIQRFIVPQDDSAPYGYTAKDKRALKAFLVREGLEGRVLSYPGADEVGLSLYAQAVQDERKTSYGVYLVVSSEEGNDSIPPFEDRKLSESLPSQIQASGCHLVDSLEKADFVLAVNAYRPSREKEAPGTSKLEAEAFAAKITTFLKEKPVALADTALTNQADPSLLFALKDRRLLLKLLSYAGWNTSGNTLGTAISEAVLALAGGDDKGRKEFLLYRYYEDYGYMGSARKELLDSVVPAHPGWTYFHLDGQDGEAAGIVGKLIAKAMARDFPALAKHVTSLQARQPWGRCFETEIHLTFKEKGL